MHRLLTTHWHDGALQPAATIAPAAVVALITSSPMPMQRPKRPQHPCSDRSSSCSFVRLCAVQKPATNKSPPPPHADNFLFAESRLRNSPDQIPRRRIQSRARQKTWKKVTAPTSIERLRQSTSRSRRSKRKTQFQPSGRWRKLSLKCRQEGAPAPLQIPH